jgi:hypothetical protein
MEAILALLGPVAIETVKSLAQSSAGQSLIAAGINQAVAIATGTPPAEAAADMANSVQAWLSSDTEWNRAKDANPPTA